ncbi:MAG: HEAT repeat domain-containing protein [Planctomycetales bacterium]|nr:HEAT repeat domain-containing protein [Planctomycetales bacterium]
MRASWTVLLGAGLALGCGGQKRQAVAPADSVANAQTPQQPAMTADALPNPNDLDAELRPFVEQLRSEDPEARREGAEALHRLSERDDGRLVLAATAYLLVALGDEDKMVRENASWALANGGPQSLPAVQAELADENPLVRDGAAHAIGWMVERGLPAEAALRMRLKDPVPAVRGRVIWALSQIGGCRTDTVHSLVALLDSDTATDRAAALHALGDLNFYTQENHDKDAEAAIRSAVPKARTLLQHEAVDVRWCAHYFLNELGLPPDERIPLLVVGLQDDSERVASYVARQLKELAPTTDLAVAVPGLCRVVQQDSRASVEACEVLRDIGPDAKDALPALLKALDSDPTVAVKAAEALWTTNRHTEKSLPVLRQALQMPHPSPAACDAVCVLGPAAASLLPDLLQAMACEAFEVKWAASDAIAAVASSELPTIRTLTSALGHENETIRDTAEETLLDIGKTAAPHLLHAVVHQDKGRSAIATLLAIWTDDDREIADQMVKLLEHPNRDVRVRCAIGLAMYSERQEAGPVLRKELKHAESEQERAEIEAALEGRG